MILYLRAAGSEFESWPPHCWVQTWASCFHTCASVTKQYNCLYVKVVTISSWLNFGRPAPREGGLRRGEFFWAPPYYSQRAVFASPLNAFSFLFGSLDSISTDPASGCVVEYRTCTWEVASSNLDPISNRATSHQGLLILPSLLGR